jgi:D-alanyl-D-alanine carboxypeptidase
LVATSAPTDVPTSLAVASPRPLPECEYLDVPVLGDPATDWATLVLDTVFALPEDFEPERLVDTGKAGLNKGYEVSRVMLDDLTAMAKAAKADDAALAVQSAYRSYDYQVRTFQGWVDQSSEEEARTVSARPGHSEHQLGTSLDFRSADDATPPWQFDDWATSRAGGWLEEHAWEHGFVMSYPKGKRGETCYAYEPWHYRYVGRDVAAAIHESGQTPRRYLWETYWATTPG